MRTAGACNPIQARRRGFTLPELMVAMLAGLALTGTVFMLLIDTVYEQRDGLADTTVEEKAYLLRANITKTLRSMSANMGISPDGTTTVYDSFGNKLGYTSIVFWSPTNGDYVLGTISYNTNSGAVIYTPNIASPSVQSVWMTNSPTKALKQFYFMTSQNIDGSQNNSLVNVVFEMYDNNFSQQGSVNNPTDIYRNFSVQLRNDY
jgi:prepilin-type N-terminal cleavage/methylation domain-containing protein